MGIPTHSVTTRPADAVRPETEVASDGRLRLPAHAAGEVGGEGERLQSRRRWLDSVTRGGALGMLALLVGWQSAKHWRQACRRQVPICRLCARARRCDLPWARDYRSRAARGNRNKERV